MKLKRIVAAACCLSVIMLFGCKNAENPIDNSSSPASTDAPTEISSEEYDVKNSVEEISRLSDVQKSMLHASSESELNEILASSTSKGAVYSSSESTGITVNGEFAGKTITVKAPSGYVLSNSADVSYVLESLGENGFTAEKPAGSVLVKGNGIKITLQAGAQAIYVDGKDCTVTFKDGEYPIVTVLNSTAILTNLTDSEIKITLANGTKVSLPPQSTYSLADETLSKAKP